MTALTDLALVFLNEGKAHDARRPLEEALGLLNSLGDQVGVAEISAHLGLVLLWCRQPREALPLLEQSLARAMAAGDRFAEKTVREHLGFAYGFINDPARAAVFFEQALDIARSVRDRKHESNLLWYLAIQYAELDQREQAVNFGQAAIDLMMQRNDPEASLYADHLSKYWARERCGVQVGSKFPESDMLEAAWSGDGAIAAPALTPSASLAALGPSLLRMAVSAAKSMAKFVGSGLATVPPQTLQRRSRTCVACEHHTGLRCRLCGCFTNVKVRMAHKECPVGRW